VLDVGISKINIAIDIAIDIAKGIAVETKPKQTY